MREEILGVIRKSSSMKDVNNENHQIAHSIQQELEESIILNNCQDVLVKHLKKKDSNIMRMINIDGEMKEMNQ